MSGIIGWGFVAVGVWVVREVRRALQPPQPKPVPVRADERGRPQPNRDNIARRA